MAEKKMPAWLKGKYTKAKDEKKDESMAKKAKLTPKEKAKFKEEDKKHPKPKTMAEDKKMDAKIIKDVKKKKAAKK